MKGEPGALLRYRIMAYVTGTMLLLCCLVAAPLKYIFHGPDLWYLWMLHGYLFIVYLIAAADLWMRRGWSLPKLGLIAISGTIPVLAFVMEHKITSEEAPVRKRSEVPA